MRSIVAGLLVLLLALMILSAQGFVLSEAAVGDDGGNDTSKNQGQSRLDAVGEVLLVFLVLSAIFEIALTPIFNSRLFLARFDGKGVKIPLTLILALLVFWNYNLDVLRGVLVALDIPDVNTSPTFWGKVITAFLIAGGSDGVFRIFTKLGIRNPKENEEKGKGSSASYCSTARER